jgi:hypothetical protein
LPGVPQVLADGSTPPKPAPDTSTNVADHASVCRTPARHIAAITSRGFPRSLVAVEYPPGMGVVVVVTVGMVVVAAGVRVVVVVTVEMVAVSVVGWYNTTRGH